MAVVRKFESDRCLEAEWSPHGERDGSSSSGANVMLHSPATALILESCCRATQPATMTSRWRKPRQNSTGSKEAENLQGKERPHKIAVPTAALPVKIFCWREAGMSLLAALLLALVTLVLVFLWLRHQDCGRPKPQTNPCVFLPAVVFTIVCCKAGSACTLNTWFPVPTSKRQWHPVENFVDPAC